MIIDYDNLIIQVYVCKPQITINCFIMQNMLQ